MKKQKGSMSLFFIGLLLVLSFIVAWIFNIVKLTSCDFDSKQTWKCEIVHIIGVVIPPSSVITVWFDTDATVVENK